MVRALLRDWLLLEANMRWEEQELGTVGAGWLVSDCEAVDFLKV